MTNKSINAVARLRQLEQECQRMTPRQLMKALNAYVAGVADHGDDEYTIVIPNRTKKGVACHLARERLFDELHQQMDAEDAA